MVPRRSSISRLTLGKYKIPFKLKAADEIDQIYTELLASLPGYLVPKLVREIAGEKNKTPLYGASTF